MSSVYSVNNPLSNGYGLNVYSIKKKLVEEENADSQSLADVLTQNGSLPATKLVEKEVAEPVSVRSVSAVSGPMPV